jgi:hypothetical protein
VVLWGLFTAYVVLIRIWRAKQTEKLPTVMVNIAANASGFSRQMQKLSENLFKLSSAIRKQPDWLAPDPPRWLWPVFSPSPNRPYDWRID